MVLTNCRKLRYRHMYLYLHTASISMASPVVDTEGRGPDTILIWPCKWPLTCTRDFYSMWYPCSTYSMSSIQEPSFLRCLFFRGHFQTNSLHTIINIRHPSNGLQVHQKQNVKPYFRLTAFHTLTWQTDRNEKHEGCMEVNIVFMRLTWQRWRVCH